MNSRKYFTLLCGTFFLMAGFVSCNGNSVLAGSKLPTGTLVIEGASLAPVELKAEIARTPAEQEKGYMERKIIPDGTGMIFVYTRDQQMNFWMKNTPHPLSIAFIDSEGIIREIYDMEPYSLEVVSSVHSVRYALEVPAGWFTRNGITVGDRISSTTLVLLAGN